MMYEIEKTFEISASHCLKLDYESRCTQNHGHNWIITVFLKSKNLNKNGMILDFSEIKDEIHDKLDHENLNDVLEFNPTAENIAKWICEQIDYCYKVRVQENQNNIAWYIEDEKV